MDFLKKLGSFFGRASTNRTLSLLLILGVIATIPLTVYVAQQQQNTKQEAGPICADTKEITCNINGGNRNGIKICRSSIYLAGTGNDFCAYEDENCGPCIAQDGSDSQPADPTATQESSQEPGECVVDSDRPRVQRGCDNGKEQALISYKRSNGIGEACPPYEGPCNIDPTPPEGDGCIADNDSLACNSSYQCAEVATCPTNPNKCTLKSLPGKNCTTESGTAGICDGLGECWANNTPTDNRPSPTRSPGPGASCKASTDEAEEYPQCCEEGGVQRVQVKRLSGTGAICGYDASECSADPACPAPGSSGDDGGQTGEKSVLCIACENDQSCKDNPQRLAFACVGNDTTGPNSDACKNCIEDPVCNASGLKAAYCTTETSGGGETCAENDASPDCFCSQFPDKCFTENGVQRPDDICAFDQYFCEKNPSAQECSQPIAACSDSEGLTTPSQPKTCPIGEVFGKCGCEFPLFDLLPQCKDWKGGGTGGSGGSGGGSGGTGGGGSGGNTGGSSRPGSSGSSQPNITTSPTIAAQPKTCSIISTEITNGNTVKVSYGGNGRKQGAEQVRLWLANKPDSSKKIPGLEDREKSHLGEYYYLLDTCNSENNQPCTPQETSVTLPKGNYSFHCDLPETPNRCSGNPSCSYNGGNLACADWVACSPTDHEDIQIAEGTASSANQPETNGTPTPVQSSGGLGNTSFQPCDIGLPCVTPKPTRSQ